MPLYAMCAGPFARWRRPIQVFWCHACNLSTGLKVRVEGTLERQAPVLFVSNHVSYLDIPVLGSLIKATFVAKSEVSNWPFFGFVARITGTIFIQRVGVEAMEQKKKLLTRMAGGENLMLFAEGTTTDGSGVSAFKSSLFSIVEQPPEGLNVVVQPVSITYVRAKDGSPLIGERRALYGWFGAEALFPHLKRVMGLPGAEVIVRFLEPIRNSTNRKELARIAQERVAVGVALSNQAMGEAASESTPDSGVSEGGMPANGTREDDVSSILPAASAGTSQSVAPPH